MDVFEIETQWTGQEGAAGRASVFRSSRTAAITLARSGDAAELKIPEGCAVVEAAVYRCTLETSTPVATVLAMLNREIAPRRVSLEHGTLPLPMVEPEPPAEPSTQADLPL